MGASCGEFKKYPRTPHLFGSRGTDDDKHHGETESELLIRDQSLLIAEKLDGTNVGFHFSESVIRRSANKCEPPTWLEAHRLLLIGD